jgi:hypothetical protein
VDIEIYEDQTGLMIFPEKRSDKNREIVRLFDNKVELFIKKTGNKLEIYCYILSHKGFSRDLGYYIVYKDNYTDNSFTNFKNDARNIIQKLEFQLSTDSTETIIFNNIEKFDSYERYRGDIDAIINSLNSYSSLEYRSGNIKQIAVFCKELLRDINNITIAISSETSKLGSVNILINKKYDEHLTPTENTIAILNDNRRKMVDNKKREEGERGKNKIVEGFVLIKDGVNIIKNTGNDPTEIVIDEANKILGKTLVDKTKYEIDREKEKAKDKTGTGIYVIIGIMLLMLGMIAGTYILGPYLYNHYPERSPIPVPTPIISPTEIPTPTIGNNAVSEYSQLTNSTQKNTVTSPTPNKTGNKSYNNSTG